MSDPLYAITTKLNLSETHLLSCFLRGLKWDIQMIVRMFRPEDVRKEF